MTNILVAKKNDHIISRYALTADTVMHIQAAEGISYEVINSLTGKLAKNIKVKKYEGDLVLEVDGEVQVVIDDFFDGLIETSYLSHDGILKNSQQAELPAAPPPPPPGGDAGAVAAASSGGTFPTAGLAAAGVAGSGAVIAGVTSNDKKSTSIDDTDTTSNDDSSETDTTSPTLDITSDAIGTVNTTTGDVTFTFTFSEAVTGFEAGDITLAGGTAGVFTAISDSVYTLVVTPDVNSIAPLIVDVDANVATDTAGNANLAAEQLGVPVDTIAPTATVAIDDARLTLGETAQVTITFSEAVDNFTLGNLIAQNGLLSALTTADNMTWTATFTPTVLTTANSNIISLDANYTDVAGNPGSPAVSGNYDVDTNAAVVVFDLTDGGTTEINGGRSFIDPLVQDYNYEIYIKVNTDSQNLTPPVNQWQNAGNINVGDLIIFVGDTGPIRGGLATTNVITSTNISSSTLLTLGTPGGNDQYFYASGVFTRQFVGSTSALPPTGELWTDAISSGVFLPALFSIGSLAPSDPSP